MQEDLRARLGQYVLWVQIKNTGSSRHRVELFLRVMGKQKWNSKYPITKATYVLMVDIS